jgi:transketolase
LAGGILDAVRHLPERQRPNFWVIAELPIPVENVPAEFIQDLRSSGHLVVVEEHIAQGGVGQMLAHALLRIGKPPARFTHCCARGYPSGRYGSQHFHRRESGLSPESILAELRT